MVPILFTAAAAAAERARAYRMGAADVLEKPLDGLVLAAKLQVFLDLDRARRTLGARLEQVLSAVPDGVYGVDAKDRIIFANTALERLTGGSSTALPGTRAEDLLRPRLTAATQLGDENAHTLLRGVLRRADGSGLVVDYTKTLPKDPFQGSGAVMVVRDAGQRDHFETGLERARVAAEEANQAKSAFLAIMSHELRTPLNTILGFSEMIRDGAGAGSGKDAEIERYRDYAGDIFSAGTHLLELINDILDLSKIEARRMAIEPQWLETRHAIAGAMRLVRERVAQGGITLVVDLSDPVPRLWVDERAFKQIMLNLLSNALKFTPRGGCVTISVRQLSCGGARVAISDTGAGIPADRLPRLFKPFEQVDNRYNRVVTGTGLGLSLTKGLVEIHGGNVDIQSTIGVGTTVSFRLPGGPREPAADAEPEKPASWQ